MTDSNIRKGWRAIWRQYPDEFDQVDIVNIVTDFGAVGDGVTDNTLAIQNALNSGFDVLVPVGIFQCNNLVMSDDRTLFGISDSSILRNNGNGPIITMAKNSHIFDIQLDGYAGNGYTGAGIAIPPTIEFEGNQRIGNVTIRATSSYCIEYTAEYAGYGSIISFCNFHPYDLNNTYAIKWGEETASNHHGDRSVISCNAPYGPLVNATSSQAGIIVGCLAGGLGVPEVLFSANTEKIVVQSNRFGSTGANYSIDGTTNIWIGNIMAGTMTIAGTATGCIVANNVCGTITLASGANANRIRNNRAAVVDNSASGGTTANYVDIDQTTYVPTWTGSVGNPAIVDGTLAGSYSRKGRTVTVSVYLLIGPNTTFGSGVWYFALPFIPTTVRQYVGSASILDSGTAFLYGSVLSLVDGTARCYVISTGQLSSSAPMTWANGDALNFTLTYDI